MVSKVVSVGDRIELSKLNKAGTDDNIKIRPYVSQVYDIVNEQKLNIAMPMVNGRVLPLGLNTRYNLCFSSKNGLYECRAVVVDRYKENGLFVLVVEIISEMKKHQRRQYYRLDCALDVKYRPLEEEEVDLNFEDLESVLKKGPLNSGITLDISGGGMRFTSDTKHKPGDLLIMQIRIVSEGVLKDCNFLTNVIRSGAVINRSKLFEQRVEYEGMDSITREILIKFIFEQERRLKRRDKV